VSLSAKLAVATGALVRRCSAGIQAALQPTGGGAALAGPAGGGGGGGGGGVNLTDLKDDADAAQLLAGLPASLNDVCEAHSPLVLDLRRLLWMLDAACAATEHDTFRAAALRALRANRRGLRAAPLADEAELAAGEVTYGRFGAEYYPRCSEPARKVIRCVGAAV
jgi:hypothetical protein